MEKKFKEIDFVISYLYPKKIEEYLIKLPKKGCINFHPAPLPEFRGFIPYTFGILEGFPYWGVTAHYIDEEFDTGDIIQVKKFDSDLKIETSQSLERKSQIHLFKLFKETINKISKGKELSRKKQAKGRYFSKKKFEDLRRINEKDTIEIINKKIRAFWYPPHPGAYIKINGKEFSLINKELLEYISKK